MGISQTQVRRLLQKYDIQSRTSKEGKETQKSIEKVEKLAQRYKKEYKKYWAKKCEFCGKEFTVDSKQKRKKFCSSECVILNIKSKTKPQFCESCGKEIIFEKRHYKRKYCNDCKDLWKNNIPKKRVKIKCSYCGKEFFRIPSILAKNQRNYCSTECMGRDYENLLLGENNPTWKGGKGHHYTGGFYSQRKLARKRDNYTCQLCGITEEEFGQELSVHHIKNYRCFEDKHEANNLDNLVSVCEKCHRFIHSKKNVDKIFIIES